MSFCFFMHTYRDESLAVARLQELRAIYANEEIICCSDGIHSSGLASLCGSLNAHYFAGQRLKLARFGGLWVYRMLVLFLLNSSADYLIKIDPDSKFFRAFRSFPDADLFGTYRNDKSFTHINGGCLGISRRACKEIVESDHLNEQIYTSPTFSYQRFQPPYLFQGEEQSTELLIGSDLIISHVALRLKLRIDNWDDVYSSPFQDGLTHGLDWFKERYAVVHPYKFKDAETRI